MDKQEIKQRLNQLYGKSSFETTEIAKEYGTLMQGLLSKRYADADNVKSINYLKIYLTLKNNYAKLFI